MARQIAESQGPESEQSLPVDTWLDQVSNMFDPDMVSQLHGRLVIIALCRLDQNLAAFLKSSGFFEAVHEELREDFESLLYPKFAGPEAYRRDFLKILNNKGKSDPRQGPARAKGFLILPQGGPGLATLAHLCLRQPWNTCYTARYILPAGSTFKDLLLAFTSDLRKLIAGDTTTAGHLLPNPVEDIGPWKELLKPRLSDIIRDLQATEREESSTELLDRLFAPLGDASVLGTGKRLALFAEFRGVPKEASGDDIGLTSEVLSKLHDLPERVGVVISGLDDDTLDRLSSPQIWGLKLPLDPQLTRGQALSNDISMGPDRLNIVDEVHALAEAIVLRDMSPPLVVGILGGWGSGKSFALHLLEERLQEIRCEKVDPSKDGEESPAPSFPFIGHPYVIRFDAWTYSKSNLWASLMQRIFVELDRQISLEQALAKNVGVSLLDNTEIWRLLSEASDYDRDRFLNTEEGRKALQAVQDFNAGRFTERELWSALKRVKAEETRRLRRVEGELSAARVGRDRARQQLEEALDQQLELSARRLAWQPINDQILKLVNKALAPRMQDNGEQVNGEPPTFAEVRESISWYKMMLKGWGKLPLALVVCAGLAWLAIPLLDKAAPVITGATSMGSGLLAVLGMLWRGHNWLEGQRREYEERREANRAAQGLSAAELVQRAMSVASGEGQPDSDIQLIAQDPRVAQRASALRQLEDDLRQKEMELEAQRARAGMTARHGTLLDFVRERLEGRFYEDKLGLLHQVQADIQELSAALRPRLSGLNEGEKDEESGVTKDLFPRGAPRIILMIDDLDRCPPDKVVEVLEAAQLLVKTPLFVVVIAVDVRYITRALEKEYSGVLVRSGEPSGLDYIEKIIQIPYRVRAVSAPVVGNFMRSQMVLDEAGAATATRQGALDTGPGLPGGGELPGQTQPQGGLEQADDDSGEEGWDNPVHPAPTTELRVLPVEVQKFSHAEHELITLCCTAIEINPRAMKRLVNIFKLLKIIWYRQGLESGPQAEVKQAMLALLALAARFPEVMRQLLREMELVYRIRDQHWEQRLADFLSERCRHGARISIYPPDWERVGSALQDVNFLPPQLTFRGLQERNLHLVSSFSFVGETDAEREAALQRGQPLTRAADAPPSGRASRRQRLRKAARGTR